MKSNRESVKDMIKKKKRKTEVKCCSMQSGEAKRQLAEEVDEVEE